jgi:hypothetical protein
MPMIDIYASTGTIQNLHQLAMDAAAVVKSVEGVPDIALFRKNTAAFVHELSKGALSNMDGDSNSVRIHVTNQHRRVDAAREADSRGSAADGTGCTRGGWSNAR